MKRILILGLIMCFAFKVGKAQKIEQAFFSLNTEAIGLPFTNYLPIHPGAEIGLTFKTIEKQNSIHRFNAKVGGFYHERLETAIYVGAEYQYTRILFKQKLGLDFPVGLGYHHTFYPADIYILESDGSFTEVNQIGRPHLFISAGVGVSYLGHEKFQPFIRQELFIETPFANGLPYIPHSLLKIGLNIKF